MDKIELNIPAKPEYMMVVRLTASAIACRVDFCIDDIEDLKVAVAEACIMLMNQKHSPNILNIIFSIQTNEALKIDITVDEPVLDIDSRPETERELGFFILKSLMDDIEIKTEDNKIYGISMYKKCGG